LHAAIDVTVKHPYTPAAFTPQHAPLCGGQVIPAQLVPTPMNVPLHALADETMKHPYTPVVLTPQHAPHVGTHITVAHVTPTVNTFCGGMHWLGIVMMQLPVHTLQHAPDPGPHTICWHVEPEVYCKGGKHAAGPATIEHAPVAGSQHAPPLGKHVSGVHEPVVWIAPPASVHTIGSSVVHTLQQQHATIALLQGAAPVHTMFGVKFVPPICAHVPCERYEQTLFAGLQHAPGTSSAQAVALHAPSPRNHPAFLMQSQLVEAMQLPFRQHLP
jgi:hypothetical protein